MESSTSNSILECIQRVIGNLVRTYNIKDTYVDEDGPWLVILAASAALIIISTSNRLKGYSLGKLVFGNDIIPPIKYNMDWELIHQIKQTHINKDKIRKNNKELITPTRSKINSYLIIMLHINI